MVAETLLAFWTPGPGEIVLIAVVMLVVFGNRIPEVMRSLGRGLSQFKKGLRDTEIEVRRQFDAEGDEARDNPEEKDGAPSEASATEGSALRGSEGAKEGAQATLPGGRERE